MSKILTPPPNSKEEALVNKHRECFAPYLDTLKAQGLELAEKLPKLECKTTQAKFIPFLDFFSLVFLDEEVVIPLLSVYAKDYVESKEYISSKDLNYYVKKNFIQLFGIEELLDHLDQLSLLRSNIMIGEALLADTNFFKYFNHGIEYASEEYYQNLCDNASLFVKFLAKFLEIIDAELTDKVYTKLSQDIDKAMHKVEACKDVTSIHEPIIQRFVQPFYQVEVALNFLSYLEYLRERAAINYLKGGSSTDPIMPELDALYYQEQQNKSKQGNKPSKAKVTKK